MCGQKGQCMRSWVPRAREWGSQGLPRRCLDVWISGRIWPGCLPVAPSLVPSHVSSSVGALGVPCGPLPRTQRAPWLGWPHPSPLSGSEIPTLIYSYHSNLSIAFNEYICWPVIRCPRGTAQLPGTVALLWMRDGEAWPCLKGAQS